MKMSTLQNSPLYSIDKKFVYLLNICIDIVIIHYDVTIFVWDLIK